MKYLITVLSGIFLASAALQGAIRGDGDFRVVLESTSPIVSGTSDGGTFSTSAVGSSVGSLSNSEAGTFINYADIGANAVVLTAAPTTPVVSIVEASGKENDGGVFVGDPVQFTVEVTAENPLYSWFYSPDGVEFTALDGASMATLDIAEATLADSGYYQVRVSNSGGEALSEPVSLSVIEAPVILEQPESMMASLGGSVTFTVDARTDGEVVYEWFLDGIAIAGSDSESLTLDGLSLDDEGAYSVTITNEAGSATSDEAMLALVGGETDVPNALVGSSVIAVGDDGAVTYESEWFGQFTIEVDGEFGWVHTTPLGWTFMTSLSTPEEAFILPLVIGDILFTADGLYPTFAYWYAGESWLLFPETNDISTGSIWVYVYATDEWVEYEDIQ